MSDLEEAILKVSPKNGDIIFVDAEAVDFDALAQIQSRSSEQDEVVFIAAHIRPGLSLKDLIRCVDRETVEEAMRVTGKPNAVEIDPTS